MFSVILMNY